MHQPQGVLRDLGQLRTHAVILPTRTRSVEWRDFANAKPRGVVARTHRRAPAESFLYGVSASDPITFTFIAFTLLTIAFLACWIPARRVDPMIALRAE